MAMHCSSSLLRQRGNNIGAQQGKKRSLGLSPCRFYASALGQRVGSIALRKPTTAVGVTPTTSASTTPVAAVAHKYTCALLFE